MTDPEDRPAQVYDPGEEPLIKRKWSGVIVGTAGVMITLTTWLGAQVIEFDGRIDRLEATMAHLVDVNGNVRPSQLAQDNDSHIQSLDARVKLLEESLNNAWEALDRLRDPQLWRQLR